MATTAILVGTFTYTNPHCFNCDGLGERICHDLFLLFFEFDGIFNGLTITEKIYASFFHAVTLRTAGLSVVSVENLSSPSIVFSLIAMFVGAGSGSTAGGIKLTTAVIVLMSLRAMLRGREDVQIMGATIPRLIVYRSMCITFFGLGFLFVALLILTHSQAIVFEKILFEAISAFGTVGLSMGVTPQLDDLGRLMVIFSHVCGPNRSFDLGSGHRGKSYPSRLQISAW